MSGPPTRESARGFSLIELAVVVAIVMTLLTLGLGLMNAQLSSTAYLTTKKRQEAIKDALIAYLGAHRRLPCPYVPTEGSPPITGIDADPDPNPFTAPPQAACAPFGVIPFTTLGLARDIAEDGWGNLFSYQIFSDPIPPPGDPPLVCPGPNRVWGRSACFGAGKATAPSITTANSITVLDNTAGTNLRLTTNALAVIISHGPNGLGAWAAQATLNAPPVSCEERKNANGDLTGCPAPSLDPLNPSIIPPYYYFKGERQDQDDVVAWIDGTEAINTLAKQGTIKSAIAQVNDDLQTLADIALAVKRAGITISVPPTCSPSPCTPTPAPTSGCAASVDLTNPPLSVALASMRDPWGASYVLEELDSAGLPDPGSFPICIYSRGGGPETCRTPGCKTTITPTTPPAPPNPSAICKSIDNSSFDSYLVKAGSLGCS